MSTGQIVFFSGVGLLLITITLAAFFVIKRPQYSPENVAYDDAGNTQRLRNGYPTDRLTIRKDQQQIQPVQQAGTGTVILDTETEPLYDPTERLATDVTEKLNVKMPECVVEAVSSETMPLHGVTAKIESGADTAPLQVETELLQENTEVLSEKEGSQSNGTVLL